MDWIDDRLPAWQLGSRELGLTKFTTSAAAPHRVRYWTRPPHTARRATPSPTATAVTQMAKEVDRPG